MRLTDEELDRIRARVADALGTSMPILDRRALLAELDAVRGERDALTERVTDSERMLLEEAAATGRADDAMHDAYRAQAAAEAALFALRTAVYEADMSAARLPAIGAYRVEAPVYIALVYAAELGTPEQRREFERARAALSPSPAAAPGAEP